MSTTHTHACMPAQTHVQTYVHTWKHTHTQTHTYAHTHTHTHTHTQMHYLVSTHHQAPSHKHLNAH